MEKIVWDSKQIKDYRNKHVANVISFERVAQGVRHTYHVKTSYVSNSLGIDTTVEVKNYEEMDKLFASEVERLEKIYSELFYDFGG